MADAWFTKLDQMPENMRQDLTKTLIGHTMIGEYIGSQDYQHLVKYSRVSIIFYAIVDNQSEQSCLPCSVAWGLFKKFRLDVVKIEDLGTF